MTRRIIQLELVTMTRAQFARDAGRLNHRAVAAARAQHERHPSALAAAFRIRRRHPGPPGRAEGRTTLL